MILVAMETIAANFYFLRVFWIARWAVADSSLLLSSSTAVQLKDGLAGRVSRCRQTFHQPVE